MLSNYSTPLQLCTITVKYSFIAVRAVYVSIIHTKWSLKWSVSTAERGADVFDATLSYSTPDTITTSFHFQSQPINACPPPLEAPFTLPITPLPRRQRYRTRCWVCSSCCDQKVTRFHRHWICQPAQRGKGGAVGVGNVLSLPRKITPCLHHWRHRIARYRLG